jgi:alpha-L-arabinofuranosidase
VVPVVEQNKPLTGQDSLYASATVDRNSKEVIVKLVNASGKAQQRDISIEGVARLAKNVAITVLESAQLDDVNSLNYPEKVAPKESSLELKGKKVPVSLQPYSFTIIRVKTS